MNIKISGLNGYLGSKIAQELKLHEHEVFGIHREHLYGPVKKLMEQLSDTDAIINLAGAPVLQRWTSDNKKKIYKSRALTTTNLVEAIKKLPEKKRPKVFISASAIGIYQPGKTHSEGSTDLSEAFIGEVVKAWEAPLLELPSHTRQVIFRIGLVLGREAKTIKSLLLPFKLGLGGPTGNGKQPFPYIHEKDLIKAFVWALEKNQFAGTFNLVAPEHINNKEFTQALGKELNRPSFFPLPAWALKLLFGEAAQIILESPAVEPKALLEANFSFDYPTIKSSLVQILS
jgi:uncharacterized protein (TIGR01777 family)